MGAFEYTALDQGGREKRGVLEGDTARQVRHQLRTQGWTPLDVEEVEQARTGVAQGQPQRRRRTRVSAMDLALITRQLATLLRSGLPVEQALQSVAQQCGKARLERIVLAVRARVREGHSLAEGFAQFPNVFPELYVRTVEAGEQSGHLDVVLERLSDYTEKRQQMRQKTTLALFYPALLTLVAVGIVIALLTYVVPKVVKVFENVSQELPLLTRGLIATSDAARDYGPFLALVAVAGVIVGRYALRRPSVRATWDRMLLRTPLVGRVTRGTNTARFARTLSILAASNVQILEALRISAQVLTNSPMRTAVEEVGRRVREGANLSGALERTGYFPPMTLSLIATGESSGNLEGMLERAAEIQEREIETLVATLLGLFEPILILVMGGIVLLIVIAILLPIFELNQLIA